MGKLYIRIPGKMEDLTPKIIGKYRIEEEIAEGNWGKVKRAVHTETGQEVAIKILFRPRLEKKIKEGVKRLYQYPVLKGD